LPLRRLTGISAGHKTGFAANSKSADADAGNAQDESFVG
jgi:hypothetical protein